jgi:hypothetical protein
LTPSPPTIITLGRTRASARVPALDGRTSSRRLTRSATPTTPGVACAICGGRGDRQAARHGRADRCWAMHQRSRRGEREDSQGVADWYCVDRGCSPKKRTTSFEPRHDVVARGGPLLYGLTANKGAWQWRLVVTTRKGLRQLRDAKILDRYLADLTAKKTSDGSRTPSEGSDGGA